MPFIASTETRAWLESHGLGGLIRILDTPAHPNAAHVARQIHPDTITNNMVRATLGLRRGGDHEVEIPPTETLEAYFGTYSVTGKAYRTYGGPDKAFGEIARVLMEYAFVHANPTSMPKNKAAIIIGAVEGRRIDWGILIGEGLRAAVSSFQAGKKMVSVLPHFLAILYPSSSPPLSPPRTISPSQPRQLRRENTILHQAPSEEPPRAAPPVPTADPASEPLRQPSVTRTRRLPTSCPAWDEDAPEAEATGKALTLTPLLQAPPPPPSPRHTAQADEEDRQRKRKIREGRDGPGQPSKRRRLIRKIPDQATETPRPEATGTGDGTLALVPVETSLNQGKIEQGRASEISEDEVLGYKDLPAEAYEFSALLRLGTAYEIIDFLARAQVAAAARMAAEHAEAQMIQRALTGDIDPSEDRALQALGRKKRTTNATHLMEIPELNTALVEAYRELDRTTRAAKDLARRIKRAQQQAKVATELWQAAEQKLAAAAPAHSPRAPPDQATLGYDPTPPPPSSSAQTHHEADAQPHLVATKEAGTMTDSGGVTAQPPPQLRHAATQTTRSAGHSVATQTGPPLRDYRAELKAEITRNERLEKRLRETISQLQEKAAAREAEFKTYAENMAQERQDALNRAREHALTLETMLTKTTQDHAAVVKEKDREVRTLRAALDDIKEQQQRTVERHAAREQEFSHEKESLLTQYRDALNLSDEMVQRYRQTCLEKDDIQNEFIKLQEQVVRTLETENAAATELKEKYERALDVTRTEARLRHLSVELTLAKYKEEAEQAKAELGMRQPGVNELRLRTLVDRQRQHFTTTVQAAIGRAGEEWAAQAAELHILRADAENRRKEGRGFYKMDEASIQTLRADLTEDYHALVRSQTAAIEQLLEELNDEEMRFRIEAEAYAQEDLGGGIASPARPSPETTHITTAAARPADTAEGPPEPTNDTSNGAAGPTSPTITPSEQPTTTTDPETILSILEEE